MRPVSVNETRHGRASLRLRLLAGRPQGIDSALLALEVIELGRRADVVRGELDQLVGGQVAAAGVADQDIDSAVPSPVQPRQNAFGEAGVVPAVAGQGRSTCSGPVSASAKSVVRSHREAESCGAVPWRSRPPHDGTLGFQLAMTRVQDNGYEGAHR